MKELKVTAKFKIQKGKMDVFKELAHQAIETVRDSEPETIVYNYYINEKRNEAVAVERYASSEAALTHAGNVGGILAEMMEIASLKLSIFGDVSDELRNGLEPLGARIYPFYMGA